MSALPHQTDRKTLSDKNPFVYGDFSKDSATKFLEAVGHIADTLRNGAPRADVEKAVALVFARKIVRHDNPNAGASICLAFVDNAKIGRVYVSQDVRDSAEKYYAALRERRYQWRMLLPRMARDMVELALRKITAEA